jgi:hypothetical protein
VTTGRALDPLTSPAPGQKSEHLMRLTTPTNWYGRNQDRRVSNAGVSLHCFTAIPGWEVKAVTVHALPYTVYRQSPSREDTTRPVFHNLRDSALSIRPRPGLDPASTPSTVQQEEKAGMARCSGSFRRLIPDVTIVSRDGRPFLGHIATVTSTGIDITSSQGSPVPWPPPTL